MPCRVVGSKSCSEVGGSGGVLESSDWRVATGGGEVGTTSAHPGKVTWASDVGVGSSGAGAAAWREGRDGRDGSDAGGQEV